MAERSKDLRRHRNGDERINFLGAFVQRLLLCHFAVQTGIGGYISPDFPYAECESMDTSQLITRSAEIDVIIFMMLATSCSFLTTFLATYFSTEITLALIEIGDIAYGSKWYTTNYPVRLRVYMLLMIQTAQRPRVFSGYGIFDCSLMTFMKVGSRNNHWLPFILYFEWINDIFQLMNTAMSYYLMFKRIV